MTGTRVAAWGIVVGLGLAALGGCDARGPAPRVPEPAASLVAAGDVMLDRGVALELSRTGAPGPFVHVAAELRDADFAVVNLECALAARHGRVPKGIAFRAAPECATLLAHAGVDVVSLANNHAVDCGRGGMVETFDALTAAGVRWCGAGRTRPEAEAPVVLSAHGLRVAFVGFSQFLMDFRGPDGVPGMVHAEPDAVARILARARREADVVVASFHWGDEYADRPTAFQRRMARHAAAAGADVILGHHPHVLQGLAWLSRTATGRSPALVAYSLGNFVFDQERPGTRDTALLRVTLGRNGATGARVIPVEIERCRPRPAGAEAGPRIRERFVRLSRALGTPLVGDDLRLAVP